MSAPPYMRMFWGDYFKDTRALDRHGHSAYLLLLGEMWTQGGSLPNSDAKLAALALCTAKEWSAVKPQIWGYFRVTKTRITQKRLTAELEKTEETIRKRKEAGKIGGSLRPSKPKRIRQANAKQMPTYPEPEPYLKDIPPSEGDILKDSAPVGRSRLEWALPPDADARAAERAEMASEAKELLAQLGRKFG